MMVVLNVEERESRKMEGVFVCIIFPAHVQNALQDVNKNREMKYTGNIEGYTFKMENPDTIEVWEDEANEFPESYIYLREGAVRDEKDFHKEISFWWMDNKVSY